jgi:hypothetical protein
MTDGSLLLLLLLSSQLLIHLRMGLRAVSSLIDEETNWWKKELVYEVFRREEVDLICSMVSCPRQQCDKLVWAGSKNGEFSVKSAYHFAKGMEASQQGSNSNMDPITTLWKKIWRVKGPKVLQSFLWKAYGNTLPTKANLHKKGVIEDPLCLICSRTPETISHVLWNCPATRDVRLESPPRIQKCAIEEDSFLNIFSNLLEKFGEEDMQFIAITARLIWFRRNEVVFGGDFSTPAAIIRRAKEQMEAFNSADQERRDRLFKRPTELESRWRPPDMGYIKLNWDAAMKQEEGKVGMGIVAQDHGGNVVAAFCYPFNVILEPACAEALAMWKLSEFCTSTTRKLVFSDHIFSDDSYMVAIAHQLATTRNCGR